MNPSTLTPSITMIILELLLIIVAMNDSPSHQIFAAASISSTTSTTSNDFTTMNQQWKCADVISNPAVVRGELANRKMRGDPKIRRFIENCIKWGDGWRFKRDPKSSNTALITTNRSSNTDELNNSNDANNDYNDINDSINNQQHSTKSTMTGASSFRSSFDNDLLLRYLLYRNSIID